MSRWAEKPCAGDGVRLRLRDVAQGRLLPCRWKRRAMAWTWTPTGEVMARVDCQLSTGEDDGRLTLHIGGLGSRQQVVRLVSTVQPRGGLRFWMVCPRDGRLCSALYLLPGWTEFASLPRRVSYRTQRLTPRDRLLDRSQRINMAMGGSGSIFDEFPEKPKWMRWATYARKRADAERAGQASLGLLWKHISRLAGVPGGSAPR